jgi:mono/diheme cytochrome c family protein
MKSLYKIAIIAFFCISIISCRDKGQPNYQYMPNMYESVGYETYAESNAFRNGKEGQLPADGSLKQGFIPYQYANSNEGYEAAKANLKSPIDTIAVKDVPKQKELFEIYCAICHGNEGNGKGKLVSQGKILGVPSYKDRVITEGSVYHIMTYGINSMGNYANQLNQHERWLVADYVMQLKNK